MHSQVLPWAPSDTAAGKHMAMIPAGDRHRSLPCREAATAFPVGMGKMSQLGVTPTILCAECPQPGKRSVLSLWGPITITHRSLSIPPACSGSLQLDLSGIYFCLKTWFKGSWEGAHCLFSGRH